MTSSPCAQAKVSWVAESGQTRRFRAEIRGWRDWQRVAFSWYNKQLLWPFFGSEFNSEMQSNWLRWERVVLKQMCRWHAWIKRHGVKNGASLALLAANRRCGMCFIICQCGLEHTLEMKVTVRVKNVMVEQEGTDIKKEPLTQWRLKWPVISFFPVALV